MRTGKPEKDDLINIRDTDAVFVEIGNTLREIRPDLSDAVLFPVISDTIALFRGEYPGYRASNTEYHDLQHTTLVAMATARLLHGLHLDGDMFSERDIQLCMISALFHDIGLIQWEGDQHGSGAKYTTVHEQRSIDFIHYYMSPKDFSATDIESCTHMIMSTKLSLSPGDIPFQNKTVERLGWVVGTADLLAQMADREYIERLFLLFREFEEARIPGFDSDLDLLCKTQGFYENIVVPRLDKDFHGIRHAARNHFRQRWGTDRDFYEEAILGNLAFLRRIVNICGASYDCYAKYLKRGGVLEKVLRIHP